MDKTVNSYYEQMGYYKENFDKGYMIRIGLVPRLVFGACLQLEYLSSAGSFDR